MIRQSPWHCQEILVPFVKDCRLPEDTLFWIIEEDFRFWPPGKDPDKADDYEKRFVKLVTDRTAQSKAGMSLPPSQKGTGKGTSSPPSRRSPEGRFATDFLQTVARGSSKSSEVDPNFGFSQDVADVMRIATMADRCRWGDLIWLTWVPQKPKPSRIGHGSACILVTKFAFGMLEGAAKKGILRRGHIDLELLRWLKHPGEAAAAGASYVYPPIGSYTEHASECDPSQFGGDKTRPSGFNSREKPCHGTRLSGDPVQSQRYKRLFQWNGEDYKDKKEHEFPQESRLHSEEFHWISRRAFPEDVPWEETRKRWGDWGSNPGETRRQKRLYRRMNKHLQKRIWAKWSDTQACKHVNVLYIFLGSIFQV